MRIMILSAAALLATPAMAQVGGPIGDRPSFDGPFVGIQGGWQQDRQTLEITTGGFTTRGSEKSDGLLYGGQVGYDFRLGQQAVFGIEVSLTGRTGSTILDDGFDTYRLTQGRTVGTSARLGYLVGPDALIYGRAGYSNAQFRLQDGGFRANENRDGFMLGAGYEQAVGRNVSARLEYNYSDFGKDDLGTFGAGSPSELQYRRHGVTAGLNFRF
ncbi:outer membrane protein [Blastomonas fulva]|uniref:outer membrane protein n=1 Tax=Blastomonas fulva TaxID=1550728 RepID=UPI003F71B006